MRPELIGVNAGIRNHACIEQDRRTCVREEAKVPSLRASPYHFQHSFLYSVLFSCSSFSKDMPKATDFLYRKMGSPCIGRTT